MFKLSYIRDLCGPAQTYLFVNVFILILLLLQNSYVSSDMLCLGDYECYVENKWVTLVSNGIYIAFWTFVFNLMCRQGYSKFAWFLFFLPFILVTIYFFLLKGLTHRGNVIEGLTTTIKRHTAVINKKKKKQEEEKKRKLEQSKN